MLTDESTCANCRGRIVAVGELSEIAQAQQVRRQRILDLDVGEYAGARVILEFVAPCRTHFDLGYAFIGDCQTIEAGSAQLPRLHGPWDAVDAAGAVYRGLGEGGGFGPGYGGGVIRFIPTHPEVNNPVLPAAGVMLLASMNRGRPIFEVEVDVPPAAPWER